MQLSLKRLDCNFLKPSVYIRLKTVYNIIVARQIRKGGSDIMKLIRAHHHDCFLYNTYGRGSGISRNAVIVMQCPTCAAKHIVTATQGDNNEVQEKIYCLKPDGALEHVVDGKESFKCCYCGDTLEV